MHQKPNQTTQICITICYGDSEACCFLMSLSNLLMCKQNWDVQIVQIKQEAVVLPHYLQGTSQNGGKHAEIHYKQVINFLALGMESISSSSRAVCLHPTSPWHFAVF